MKNISISDILLVLLTDTDNDKVIRVRNIIQNLNKKIQVFDNAIITCNNFQDSDNFFELTKKAMKVFSEKKKAIKEKVQKLTDSLTKVQSYGMILATNMKQPLKQCANMCNVKFYEQLGNELGIDTNCLMEIKKLASTVYLFNARMAKHGVKLENLPKWVIQTCFCGGAVHSDHQQRCNYGEWLEYLNCEENMKLYNACGYTPKEIE